MATSSKDLKFTSQMNVYTNDGEPIDLKLNIFEGRNTSSELLDRISKKESRQSHHTSENLNSRLSKSSFKLNENKANGLITIES